MKIDADVVIQLRNERSWSQDELAVSSGLNLRTVQRIEKEGVISLQSKKALAAAFDIDVKELDYVAPVLEKNYEYQTVVMKSDVGWITGWGKKELAAGPYQLDEMINRYASEGWKVHTLTHGSTVHGGSGQVMILFEREIVEQQ